MNINPDTFDAIYEAMLPRLDQLGEIRTDDCWRFLIQSNARLGISYSVIAATFREIMKTMIEHGKAEKLEKAGRYRILKPNRKPATQ